MPVAGWTWKRWRSYREQHGSVQGFATDITADEVIELDVDVLMLAYDYGAVNAGNAHAVRARYVVEATNRAVLPEAERFLKAQGVTVLPDLVASIGRIDRQLSGMGAGRQQLLLDRNRD